MVMMLVMDRPCRDCANVPKKLQYARHFVMRELFSGATTPPRVTKDIEEEETGSENQMIDQAPEFSLNCQATESRNKHQPN